MIRAIGIMTGNSLDAVDTVITEFDNDKIIDICSYSQEIPIELADGFRKLKSLLKKNDGNIDAVSKSKSFNFKNLHDSYINLVAKVVKELILKANLKAKDIDIIGFHGQTCAHLPPSISNDGRAYTIQIGSGQMLADLTKIPVAFDFRSDDILNGGEGAPLAPVHNLHIAQCLKLNNVAFLNAGNTGNIAIISQNKNTKAPVLLGFDVGPCNHFIDLLARTVKNESCDFDGKFGVNGKVIHSIIKKLYKKATHTKDGRNFFEIAPPKSSDPSWYKAIPEIRNSHASFEDRIRTVEYFSAYLFVDALKFIPENIERPKHFLIFGGGWQNPILLGDFKKLLLEKIPDATIEWSDVAGFSGKYMEARIFADMAKCKLLSEPFTFPETTGCQTPTICGIIVKPKGKNPQLWSRASH